MTDFRDAYKDAAEEIRQPDIDACSVLNKARRRRARLRYAGQKSVTIVTLILLVCAGGFTTVRAADYFGSIIRVSDRGFVSGDVYTMTDSGGGAQKRSRNGEPEAGDGLYGDDPAEMQDEIEIVELDEMLNLHFDSVEDFQRECPERTIALPELIAQEEEVHVVGDMIYVRYKISDHQFIDIQCFDYHGSQGHSSAVSFGEEICNERSYTTSQGFTYTLIDSVADLEDGEQRIHGAVSVEYYEIFINFYGFEEDEAQQVLEGIDLSLYCGNS